MLHSEMLFEKEKIIAKELWRVKRKCAEDERDIRSILFLFGAHPAHAPKLSFYNPWP